MATRRGRTVRNQYVFTAIFISLLLPCIYNQIAEAVQAEIGDDLSEMIQGMINDEMVRFSKKFQQALLVSRPAQAQSL